MTNAPARRPAAWPARVGVAAAFAWLAASAVVTASETWWDGPGPSHFASSPSLVARGEEWRLLTSALPVSRFPFAELLGCLIAIVVALRLVGPFVFWAVALAAHVGATLLVYAGVGFLWLVDRSVVSEAVTDDDYGISAVWMGALGAIAAGLAARGRRAEAAVLVAVTIAVCMALLWVGGGVAAAEHLVALALGAVVARACASAQAPGRWLTRRRLGSWPSARSAATLVRGRSSGRSNSR